RDSKYQNCRPADLLEKLHGVLALQWQTTRNFVAALALLLDPMIEEVVAANAGQPDWLLGQPGGSWRPWAPPRNPLLGVPAHGVTFQEAMMTVPVGDWLLGFTDGVTEAGAHSGAPQFHQAQLPAFLTGLPAGIGPDEVVSRLMTASMNYVGVTW